MYIVFLRGLEFYGYHGVPDAEQEIGHRYSVDVELLIEGSADISDEIGDTVDYGKLSQEITQLGTTAQFRTVERLACAMGESILAGYPLVMEVEIEVSKLLPPAPVILAEAGARINLARA